MAEELYDEVKHFAGLSSDTKTTSQVGAGSTWFERDTGIHFKFDGVGWGIQGAGIDFVTGEIIAGHCFLASQEFLGVSDSASIEILIQTGATFQSIVDVSVAAEGLSSFQIFEGTTFTVAGTSVPSFNKNRESAITAEGIITHTPTLIADGTQLGNTFLGGRGAGQASASGVENVDGFIFARSTNYLIRATNNSGSAKDMVIDFVCIQRNLS